MVLNKHKQVNLLSGLMKSGEERILCKKKTREIENNMYLPSNGPGERVRLRAGQRGIDG